jgi:hypothetical protein
MNEPNEIAALMAYIASKWTYDAETYPHLEGASAETVYRFGIYHSVGHLAKTAGSVAGHVDRMDHGQPLDKAALLADLGKGIANYLRIAEHIGLSPEELVHAIRNAPKRPPRSSL